MFASLAWKLQAKNSSHFTCENENKSVALSKKPFCDSVYTHTLLHSLEINLASGISLRLEKRFPLQGE